MTSDRKVIYTALVANLVVAAAKTLGAIYTGSRSLGAEAIHSVADSINELLLLVGEKRSRRPPTQLHPLGYGRESYFWALIVALLLFSMGGLFSIYRGVTQLASPHQVSPGIAIAVLLIAAVSEAHSFRTTLRRIYALNKNIRWLHWFKTSSRANLLVVFTEDLAALAGIAVALVALMITWLTGDSRWDSVGAIAIGVILVVVTFALTNELRSLLIGESPFKNYKRDVGLLLQEIIPGAKLRGFTAIQTGPEDVTLAYRITPGRIHDVKQLIEKMEILQNRIVEKFPEVHRQFMSPV